MDRDTYNKNMGGQSWLEISLQYSTKRIGNDKEEDEGEFTISYLSAVFCFCVIIRCSCFSNVCLWTV